MNSEFKVGDTVKVIDPEWCYDTYKWFITQNNITGNWIYGAQVPMNATGRVIFVGPHGYSCANVFVVEIKDTKQIFLMSKQGLELIVEPKTNKRPHHDLIVQWANDKDLVIEFKMQDGSWLIAENPSWYANREYRIQPPKTKSSINWDHVSSEYKWLTRDEHGVNLHQDKPDYRIHLGWCSDFYTEAECFASYQKGDCYYKDDLIQRPE